MDTTLFQDKRRNATMPPVWQIVIFQALGVVLLVVGISIPVWGAVALTLGVTCIIISSNASVRKKNILAYRAEVASTLEQAIVQKYAVQSVTFPALSPLKDWSPSWSTALTNTAFPALDSEVTLSNGNQHHYGVRCDTSTGEVTLEQTDPLAPALGTFIR